MRTNYPEREIQQPEDELGRDALPAENHAMPTKRMCGEYLTTDEAADYMRRSACWLLRQKDIPYLPGHPNTYKRQDLDRWFEENKRQPLAT